MADLVQSIRDLTEPAVADNAPLFADAILALLDKHRPHNIYTDCGHDHDGTDPGDIEIDDVGFVCQDGYEYTICDVCCTTCGEGDFQTEDCCEGHDHKADGHCPNVVTVIAAALGCGGQQT